MTTYHVIPAPDAQWDVKKPKGKRYSHRTDDRLKAIEWATAHDADEVVVHDSTGRIDYLLSRGTERYARRKHPDSMPPPPPPGEPVRERHHGSRDPGWTQDDRA